MTSTSATNALDLINSYYASKPDFNAHIGSERPPKPPTDQLERLGLHDETLKKNEFLKGYLGISKSKVNMPVHPAEENATGSMLPPGLRLCIVCWVQADGAAF
jgi:hypothetical protein